MIYYDPINKIIYDENPGLARVKEYPDTAIGFLPTKETEAQDWQRLELAWISEQIEMKTDGYRKAKNSGMADLRKYRNEIRDYVKDGVIGEKPARPE